MATGTWTAHEITTTLLSGAAIVVAIWAAVMSNRAQRTALALQQQADARDAERHQSALRAALRANLECALTRQSPNGYHLLQIRNRGPAAATAVQLAVHDTVRPDDDSPVLDKRDDYGPLAPGTEVSVRMFVHGLGPRPQWDTRITWVDDSGEPGSRRTMLMPE